MEKVTRVLMVGHTFSVASYRKLLQELSSYKDLELYTIYPNNWKDDFKTIRLSPEDKKLNLITPHAVFVPHMYRFFYPSISLFFKIISLKPDIIHINEEPGSIIALQALIWAKLTGAKVLFNTYENIYRRQRFPLGLIYKLVAGSSEYALTIHEECVEVLRKKGYKGKVKITFLGFDPEKFKKKDVSVLRKKFGIENFAIGFMGRLSQEKGILTLIEACSKLRFPYHLILDKYVNTDFIKEMEERAKELNVKGKIIYIDPAYEEVADYINLFDVLVLPSQTTPWWKEQFGRVLVEAMACEVPVIGSSSGSIPFVIGDAGLVFEEGSAKELAEKITELNENEVLRRKLIAAGKERSKLFTWKRIAKDYYNVYKEIEKGIVK